ncbi:MAG TPA: carbohydrate kinase [Burkholderiaceae bacterium]|nr:carbohydrate kinase [Burkholderiaceae bacterium]
MHIVCGEALMDVFGAGETPTGALLNACVGGSPFNVAVGLARLTQPVAFLGAVSTDFLGERLMKALAQEGVVTAAVVRTSAPTTLGLVGLDSHGVPTYSFYGAQGADRQLTREALVRIPVDARVFHLGSYATVVEPIAATLRALVEAEHRRSLIAYDPNIRLNVEPDLTRWRETLQWMLTRTHLLKVSEEDLTLLFPGAPVEALAAQWLRDGVRMVVVTRGARGAVAWNARGSVEVPTVPLPVVDTVGAGDTVQAALLTWLAENDCLRPAAIGDLDRARLFAAVQFATQAAAITCSRQGADLPRRSELSSR